MIKAKSSLPVSSVSWCLVSLLFLLLCNLNPIILLQTKAAYVLFYQRRDEESPSKPQPSASLGAPPESADDHMDTN